MAKPELEEVLEYASVNGASDVHITVGVPPKMRVNGRLITLDQYDRLLGDDTEKLVREMLNEQQFETLMQNGEFDTSISLHRLGRFRLNIFKQRNSLAVALRVVGTEIPDPVTLGVPESVVDLYQRKRGLVLVTGPTGSGKSTTLATIIDKINKNRDAHVITLEDPIEFTYRHNMSIVNQREIGLDSNSYSNALRAALREDPDVILVGEMRDFDTISVAITAAETGHLVLSTLHTIGAASTVDRVIDVFPPHQQQQIRVQLANVLECVVSQQLIPKVDGSGRVAAFEVLHSNHAVRNLIREGKAHQLQSVMQTNRKLGMMVMDEAIVQLYNQGLISKDSAVQFAVDPDTMANKLSNPL